MNQPIPSIGNPQAKLPLPMGSIPPTEHGFKVFLMGTPGSGKTKSLETLLQLGLDVFCIFTEPYDTISKEARQNPLFHYAYVPAANPGIAALLDNSKKINTMNQKMLSNLDDIAKKSYGQLIKLLETLANFVDQNGKSYGSVDSWDNTRILAIDSLSGLNIMAMDLVVGGKPIKSQGDWGIAMDNLERILNQLTIGCTCHFVLTGHIDIDKDELTGRFVHLPAGLGKKSGPKIPRFFTEVVKTYRNGKEFHWATNDTMADCLKFRLLPNSDKLPPTFLPVYEAWKKRVEAAVSVTNP